MGKDEVPKAAGLNIPGWLWAVAAAVAFVAMYFLYGERVAIRARRRYLQARGKAIDSEIRATQVQIEAVDEARADVATEKAKIQAKRDKLREKAKKLAAAEVTRAERLQRLGVPPADW